MATAEPLFNISAGAGTAQWEDNRTVGTFLVALASGVAVFVAEFILFSLLKDKVTRI